MSGPAARIRGSLVEWSAEMTKRLSYTKQASFIAKGNNLKNTGTGTGIQCTHVLWFSLMQSL